jgi:hypothetical protein
MGSAVSGDAYFREEQVARSASRRHHENRGRLAVSWGIYVSAGVGPMEFPEECEFDCRQATSGTITLTARQVGKRRMIPCTICHAAVPLTLVPDCA